jgi:alanine racemase
MSTQAPHPTQAFIHLDRLARNLRLLQGEVGARPLWPAVKANAYGHDARLVAGHLVSLGYRRLCVAHPEEALDLLAAGVDARFVVLSAALPESARCMVEHGLEPAVCSLELVEALGREASRAGKQVHLHVKVDTGMGRIGIRPEDACAFLDRCAAFPALAVRGLMSHFPRADEADKSYSQAQIETFREVVETTRGRGIEFYHLANSAGILDLPQSHFDAARPGIAMYGLEPSPTMASPRVAELEPVLEWKTRVTFLKEVPTGTGLSYGHAYHTERQSLIATIPCGYGDGLNRRLSSGLEVLVGGARCPLVGRVTMDQSLIDVTALRGQVALGDEVVIVGRQGDAAVTADAMAARLGTINYEVVTAISARVPRVALHAPAG